jgi:hypothetical protein
MRVNYEIDEVGKRYSVFYLVGCVASAFAGILAYGVRPISRSISFPLLPLSLPCYLLTSILAYAA